MSRSLSADAAQTLDGIVIDAFARQTPTGSDANTASASKPSFASRLTLLPAAAATVVMLAAASAPAASGWMAPALSTGLLATSAVQVLVLDGAGLAPRARPAAAPSLPAPWRMAKAACDRLVAAIAILLLLPLLLLIAVLVCAGSQGPAIFRQRRHGEGGREFVVFKFRTMRWNADAKAGDGLVQTKRGDCRVTRVGDFLRSTSLDELPQLFNVLNGSMSLVGPRPHPVAMRTEDRLGEEVIADYAKRHRVKPGITGWAQINGWRGATDTVDQLRRRVEHDNFYIDNWSFLWDLRILAVTPIRILFDRDNAF